MNSDAQFSHAHVARFDGGIDASADRIWTTLTDVRRLPGGYGDGVIEPSVGGRPFVKLNAAGWHPYLDMVEAETGGGMVGQRDVYMRNNAVKYGATLPAHDRIYSEGGSSSDVTRKCALADATGRARSSCQASAKTLTMRRPCLVTLAAAMTSRGPAERR